MSATICPIKVFISLRLIQRFAKKRTSSTVFAFKTMKAINAPPRMSPTNKMAQRNPSITESEVLFACFFVSSEVSSFVFLVFK